jgi:mono/diheme cytochrome c family protein
MNAASTAPVPWSADQLFDYLRHGWDEQHGVAAGPMAPVVHDLSQVAEEDVRAIAVYVASLMPPRPAAQARSDAAPPVVERDEDRALLRGAADERRSAASSAEEGAIVYAGACSDCHNQRLSPLARKPVRLSLATSVNAPGPSNVIHVVLEGIWPEAGGRGPLMPGFAAELTEGQVVGLVSYLRGRFSKLPAWSDVPARVREISRAKEDEP